MAAPLFYQSKWYNVAFYSECYQKMSPLKEVAEEWETSQVG